MTAARPADILRLLEPPGAPDGDLLALFARTRDASAFAELVRRHGPLVLGVCRRVTGNVHDAEDAFQASFLVLAQKAGSLTNAALLGNWLYGVAFRVASRAKRAAARRRAREVTVPTMPDPPAPDARAALPELGPILDEELAALAAHYRDAIVLCDLRGLSREAAAEALGVPEGTLSSRLANGRKKLAARLARRGVALPAAGLAAALGTATASVPAELLARTCETVTDWAATGTAPAALAALTKGGFAMRATVLLGSVLALGVAGAVFAALPATAPPVPPKPPEVARAADPNADEKQPAEKGTAFGAPRLARAFDEPIAQLHAMVWNAKGTHLALQGFEDPKIMSFTRVSLFPLDATAVPISGTRWGAEVLVAVTPDGTGAVTLLRESQLISGNHRLTFLAPKAIGGFGGGPMGIAGLEATRTVKLEPSSAQDHAFAPDLKSFRMLVPVERADAEKRSWDVMEVSAETGEVGKRLLELPDGEIVLSPDGRRAALLGEPVKGVTVSDVGAGKTLFDAGLPPPGDPTNSHGVSRMAFSRDGGVLVVSLGRGSSVVLDVPTGRRRPALEGADLFKLHPSGGSFSPDGRLLACVAQRYKTEEFTDKGNDGRSVQRKRYATNGAVLVVWDTTTGKLVKLWPAEGLFGVAFNPVRPLLAVAESNGTTGTRVGFWDFAAEVKK